MRSIPLLTKGWLKIRSKHAPHIGGTYSRGFYFPKEKLIFFRPLPKIICCSFLVFSSSIFFLSGQDGKEAGQEGGE